LSSLFVRFTLVAVGNLVVASAILGGSAGCSPKDSAAPNNGVDDVRKACEARATWKNKTATKCINCIAAAPSPKCACEEFVGFSGLCQDQGAAWRAEANCTDAVNQCPYKCADTDCACIEACYAQADACKRAAAAKDGCVADVCAQYCQ
jgi:hypothetical protein